MVISFLGCGWLGMPLAYNLLQKGHVIRASTTNSDKLARWRADGIDPYLVHFGSETRPDLGGLSDADILLITVPPGRRAPGGHEAYLDMIDEVCAVASSGRFKRILFTSSTSVYSDECRLVFEDSIPAPANAGGKVLLEAERRLGELPLALSVVRLAGLIGPGRMPGKFFAGKKGIPNGGAPVNLLHLDDAVGFLEKLVFDEGQTGVFNLCAPSHPSKNEFYKLAAYREGLEQPEFIDEKLSWKLVDSKRSMVKSFPFRVGDLNEWLKFSKY